MRSNPKCIASNNFMVINRDVFVKNRSWSNLTYLFWKYTKQGTAIGVGQFPAGFQNVIFSTDVRDFIYNMTNDCTIISNTIITNNMLLHVSTFKMSSSGSSLCLAKITYRFSGLSKMKLLKCKMINLNKMLIVQRNKRFA